MSHITKIKTQMVEKEALLKAIKDLGYSYEEGDLEIQGFGGTKIHVQIKIPMRLGGDIGFQNTPTGYQVVADWWEVHGVKPDDFTNALAQRYAYNATLIRLEEQGFQLVEESSEKTGQIRLVLRRTA